MNNYKLIFIFILSILINCRAEAKTMCDYNTFESIKTDFDKSYKQYKTFWNTLNCYGEKAINGDNDSISSIISLEGVGAYNSEFTEWYAETIANIFLKSPQKLFDLLLQKDIKTIDSIMYYLEKPIGEVEKDKIVVVAKKIGKKPKYRALVKRLTNK